ncbi:hypothetical protein [uncultured Paludibaculum sp.]|uniref:hypothetical protein n=1 Tax=uncultured Paludibaculum sp. TaxID=1765020 RepID=UPI002AABFB36|nr:hypothetical protein [uncultured Paludibaculum sp.]
MTIHLAMLRSAAWLVPGEQRAEWLAEWSAELWHIRRTCERQATAFCLGAFRDALWMRRNCPPEAQPAPWLESPARCLGFLGLVAAACALLALCYHRPTMPLPVRGPILAMLYMGLMAVPIVAAITSLRLGTYPAHRNAWRWAFFAAKIALVLFIVFFGVLDLAALVGLKVTAGPIHLILFGNVAALRWALIDQRRRCPECLRLLTHPARIGVPSQTFLEWYGTEFMCAKGHGLLHVPEIPTVSFRTQSWMHLDRSWKGLFL